MNTYLAKILTQLKTIIIPGLGALTVTNERTGEIMFLSYLKFDDGELAKFIAAEEGIEVNDAKNQLAKYVREIHATLDRGEYFDLFQFGRFEKTNNEITFTPWNELSGNSETPVEPTTEEVISSPESTPIEEIAPDPISEETEVQPNEQPATTLTLDEILDHAEEPASVPEDDPQSSERKAVNDSETIPTAETPELDRPEIPSETSQAAEKEIIEIPENENAYLSAEELAEKEIVFVKASTEALTNETKTPSKRGFRFWMLFVILPLVFVSGIGIYVIYESMRAVTPALQENLREKFEETLGVEETFVDEMTSDTTSTEETTSPEPAAAPDPIEQEAAPAPEKTTTRNETSSPQATADPSAPYQLIVGSFSSEENARKLVKTLENEGAVYLGSSGGMHLVSLGGYQTISAAQQALTVSGKKGWIKKM